MAELELLNEMLLTFVVCISSVKRIYLLSYCCVLLACVHKEGCHHVIDVICSLISVYFLNEWADYVLIFIIT